MTPSPTLRVEVAANGRLDLPIAVRRELGLENGGVLSLQVDEDGMVLRTRRQMARRAQMLARELLGNYEGSLVDELITERRAEAARELIDSGK